MPPPQLAKGATIEWLSLSGSRGDLRGGIDHLTSAGRTRRRDDAVPVTGRLEGQGECEQQQGDPYQGTSEYDTLPGRQP